MISFSFKRKKIVVDTFTNNSTAYEMFKIRRSTSFLPDWWKVMPMAKAFTLENKFVMDTNMRHRTGMIDIYRLGFTLPMWTEARIVVDPKGEVGGMWQFADHAAEAGQHSAQQRGTFLPETEYMHLKLNPPWRLKTKESLVWLMFQPTYSYKAPDQAMVLPGTIDFQWGHEPNVQMMFRRLEGRHNLVTISPGEPLATLMPLTDKEVELRYHLVDRETLSRISGSRILMNGDGMHRRKLAKCPVNH